MAVRDRWRGRHGVSRRRCRVSNDRAIGAGRFDDLIWRRDQRRRGRIADRDVESRRLHILCFVSGRDRYHRRAQRELRATGLAVRDRWRDGYSISRRRCRVSNDRAIGAGRFDDLIWRRDQRRRRRVAN
ncbi:MAG: hypothetical protein V1899_03475 [Planctomycetota bacterium]